MARRTLVVSRPTPSCLPFRAPPLLACRFALPRFPTVNTGISPSPRVYQTITALPTRTPSRRASMSITNTPAVSLPAPEVSGWRTLGLLNRYHWFVFIVASMAWILDCMDQQLFNLARASAVAELMPLPTRDDPLVAERVGRAGLSLSEPMNVETMIRALHGDEVKKYAGYA